MFKKLVPIILAITMLLGISTTAFASENLEPVSEQSNSISAHTAQQIAIRHIQYSLMLSENETNDLWHWGMLIGDAVPMYDLNQTVSSYCFSLLNAENQDAGYIIIGSNYSYAPVIEYSTSGTFYPAEKLSRINANTIYYDGGLDYYAGDGETYYNLQNGETLDVSVRIYEQYKATLENNYSSEWAIWESLLSEPSAISNPPTSGSEITKPDDYESGYQTKTAKNVTGYGLTYKNMNSFSGYSNHCAPTVATNIMYYWYNRNSSTYSALRKDSDNTWLATFKNYHSLMETTATNGTYNSKLQNAYSTYLKNAGFNNSTVTYSSSASWNTMKTELDGNYPFHLIVQGHYFYGDHSIVGLGYEEYKHSALTYSRYIRVADGWSSSSGRFVHTSVGNSAIRMVKVRPA